MLQITECRETKRGRFALFSEGEFLFSVDGETLQKFGIEAGTSLSEGDVSALREASDTRKAKDQALRFLSRRAHGKKELYAKLCRTQDEYSAAAAIAAMAELGLLNDEDFAAQRAEALAYKDKSSFEIRHKLMEQGIAETEAEEAVAALGLDDGETARRIVEKKYRDKLLQGKRETVMAALARRGFTRKDITGAVEAALAEQDEE